MAGPGTTQGKSAQPETPTRRDLIRAGGLPGAALATGAAGVPGYLPRSPLDTGGMEGGGVNFPNWRAATEPPSGPLPRPTPPGERIGFAIVVLAQGTPPRARSAALLVRPIRPSSRKRVNAAQRVSIVRRRIAPLQFVADHADDAAEHAPVIHPRLAVR
jgi:hypothetical protein